MRSTKRRSCYWTRWLAVNCYWDTCWTCASAAAYLCFYISCCDKSKCLLCNSPLRSAGRDLHGGVQGTYLWWNADSPSSNSETGPLSVCRPSYLLLRLHPCIHPPRDLHPPCCPPLHLSGFLHPTRTLATAPSCRCHCCHSCPRVRARPPRSPAGSASQFGCATTRGEMKVGSAGVSGNEREARRLSRWFIPPAAREIERESAEEGGGGGGGGLPVADICCTIR